MDRASAPFEQAGAATASAQPAPPSSAGAADFVLCIYCVLRTYGREALLMCKPCNPHKQNETSRGRKTREDVIQQVQSRSDLAAARAGTALRMLPPPVALSSSGGVQRPVACLVSISPVQGIMRASLLLAAVLLVCAAAVQGAGALACACLVVVKREQGPLPLRCPRRCPRRRTSLPSAKPLPTARKCPTAAQETLEWTLVSEGSGRGRTGAAHSCPRPGWCPPTCRRSPPAETSGAGCWVATLHITYPACLGCSSVPSLQGQNYQPKTFTDGQTLKFTWTGGCRHCLSSLCRRCVCSMGRRVAGARHILVAAQPAGLRLKSSAERLGALLS